VRCPRVVSCPVCGRGELEFGGRWSLHHDHAYGSKYDKRRDADARFPAKLICHFCNMADGEAKKRLKLPKGFSFSPAEISRFIRRTSAPISYTLALLEYILAMMGLSEKAYAKIRADLDGMTAEEDQRICRENGYVIKWNRETRKPRGPNWKRLGLA
jgi:hypothetical protein